jgi:hypothetical protein
MSDNKIDNLLTALKDVLETGKELSEVPYIKFVDDVSGKGLLWVDRNQTKQFIFNHDPDRFFVSENIDIGKNKSISINKVKVLDSNELGPTITKSNIKELGRLKGLVVDGDVSINQYLYYDSKNDRLGIGTDQPNATVSIVDGNIELVLGSSDVYSASVGTYNSADLELVTDNTARITLKAGGNIELGNKNFGPVQVSVIGSMAVNVNSIDPRTNLHVNGPIKFNNKIHLCSNEPPQGGNFNEGDIVWNSNPAPGKHVGWVCTKAGNPGLWNQFGEIK